MPKNYTEHYRIWYVDYVESDTGIGYRKARRLVGNTENLDRAEAVEMFLVENGYEGVIIETVHYFDDGTVEDDVLNKLTKYRDIE